MKKLGKLLISLAVICAIAVLLYNRFYSDNLSLKAREIVTLPSVSVKKDNENAVSGISGDMADYLKKGNKSIKRRDCLNDRGKEIYDGMYEALVKFEDFEFVDKSRSFDYKSEEDLNGISLCFSDILSYYVLADHPEIFWSSGGIDVITAEAQLDGTKYKAALLYGCSREEAEEYNRVIEKGVEDVLSECPSVNLYEKVLYYHDWIVNNVSYVKKPYYNPSTDGKQEANLNNTTYELFNEKTGNCNSYAKAFSLFMERLGVDCTIAVGEVEGGLHAWNVIKLGENFYNVDVTWDEETNDNSEGASNVNISHAYFCITDNEIYKTRSVVDNLPLPECDNTEYDYYRYFGLLFSELNSDNLAQAVSVSKKRNSPVIELKFQSEEELSSALEYLSSDNSRLFRMLKNAGVDSRTVSYTENEDIYVLNIAK